MNQVCPIAANSTPHMVTLASSPLRHVLCVLQFAPILKISDPSGQGIAGFQDRIRAAYPSFRQEQQHELRLEANEAGQIVDQPLVISHPAWIFSDVSQVWSVTLTQQSIAIASTGDGYAGRADLISRLTSLLDALSQAYQSVVADRLGFRFVNLFEGELFANLDRYTNPAMIGFGRQAFGDGFVSSFGQTEGVVGSSRIIVKTGRLKPGAIGEMFPAPLTEQSWLLDIDAAHKLDGDMSPEQIRDIAVELTNINCQMFRWSVSNVFMKEFSRG